MKRRICIQILWLQLFGMMPSLWGMELSSEVLTNHVGYPPAAAKFCFTLGDESLPFKVIDTDNAKTVFQGPKHLIGLCDLYETVPDHGDAPRWKEAIRMYCEEYIFQLAEPNDFHLVPWGLFLAKDPGGNRKIGDYWVRYLSITDQAREGGINANIASSGIGLLKASRILENEELKMLAQRQLDWILGANPFNASTVEKVGNNQPLRFINKRLKIPPLIPGAVMNGIGGTEDDHPHLKAGSWQNCEYWTPPVAYTMWLMAELQMRSQ